MSSMRASSPGFKGYPLKDYVMHNLSAKNQHRATHAHKMFFLAAVLVLVNAIALTAARQHTFATQKSNDNKYVVFSKSTRGRNLMISLWVIGLVLLLLGAEFLREFGLKI